MMSMLLLSLAASPVAWRAVSADDGVVVLYRFSAPVPSHWPVVLCADFGFGRRLLEPLARSLAERGHPAYIAEVAGQGHASPVVSLAQAQRHLGVALKQVQLEEHAPIDVVFHGWLGTIGLALVAQANHLFVRRVVAVNVPVVAEVSNAWSERWLLEGGRFTDLAGGPQGRERFVQLFSLGHDDASTVSDSLGGARDLGQQLATELLAWQRVGDAPIGDLASINAALRTYRHPTLIVLALANEWAPPELCAPLKRQSNAVVPRLFSRVFDMNDYSHATVFSLPGARRDVFVSIAQYLEGSGSP